MFKPQLAKHLYDEEAKRKPAYVGKTYAVMEKLDGWYGYFDIADGNIRSRAGRVLPSCAPMSEKLRDHCANLGRVSGVLIFEILVRRQPEFHVLNGTLNRKAPCNEVYLKVHDFVTNDTTPFVTRYKTAALLIDDIDADVSMVHVLDRSDCPSQWKRVCELMWAKGGEGVILKRENAPYTMGKRNADVMKIKEEVTMDLWCIGIEEGEGKFKGMTGSLTLIDAAGNIHNVSGMSDAERTSWWRTPEQVVNHVVEVKAMKILKDGSLREPRFKAIRFDKGFKDID